MMYHIYNRFKHAEPNADAAHMVETIEGWRCIGCGRVDAPQPCIGVCEDKRVELVSGLGGMFEGQVRGLRAGDVMLVVSFSPYADESLQCVRLAADRGARVLAITDSQMSPLAALADATLVVHESSTFGFRALTNTMCLAQSLFIALAYRTELLYAPGDGSAFTPVRPV